MSDDATPHPETGPATAAANDRRQPGNRAWLLIVAAALVFGCFMGAGAMAIGTFVAGHLFHGRDRAYVDQDRRGDHRQPPIRKHPAPPKLPGQPGQPGQPNLPPRIPSPVPTPTPST